MECARNRERFRAADYEVGSEAGVALGAKVGGTTLDASKQVSDALIRAVRLALRVRAG